jgi:hypothetical protein
MGVPEASKPHLAVVPDKPPEPPLGAVRISGMGGWAYRPGVDVWYLPQGGDEWFRKLAWCPEVVDAVRYPAQDGQTITRRFAVKVGDQQEVISLGDLIRGPGIWGRFARACGFSGRYIGDVLVNIVMDQAKDKPDLIGYPFFKDGHLQVPPTAYLPDGYTNGEGSSVEALKALADELAKYPVAALTLGLSAAAPWVSALELQPFTVHFVGDSTTGKTTVVTAASALWGCGFKGVTQIWNGTKLSVPGQLRDLGVLPAFRDELGTAGLASADRAVLFSTIMEGCKRGARTRDDLPRPSASWASILFSTGNIAAVPASHASAGHPKGIIEIHADTRNPVIPESVKDRIQALTNADGMAGSWVPYARRLTTEAMRQAVRGAGKDLGAPPADGLHWHMWRAMSLGLAGARALAIITGNRALADAALLAAKEVIASSADRMQDIGADHGQRLIDTITEYLSFRPMAFGFGDPRDLARVDQMGFITKTREGAELVCVYPSKHAEVARTAAIEDVTTALRQLRSDGRLVTSKGQGLKYRARTGTSLISVYAYYISERTDQNSQNSQNNAGQGPVSCSDQGPGESEQKSEQASSGWESGTLGASENPALASSGSGSATPGMHAGNEEASSGSDTAVTPCPACGLPLPASPALVFNGHHMMCEPEPSAEPASTAAAPNGQPVPAEPSTAVVAPDTEPLARTPVTTLTTDDELAGFRTAVDKAADWPGATDADYAAALRIFHGITEGVRWVSYAGQTGQAAMARLVARYPSMKAPVALTDERALDWCQRAYTVDRYHVTPGQTRKLKAGQQVIGCDINGQYPGAAGSTELGDGDPQWITSPMAVTGMLNLPGYAMLAKPVKTRHPALGTLGPESGPLPMPLIKYLSVDLGLELAVAEVMWWQQHGRRMRTYIDHCYRQARKRLAALPDTTARAMARTALKKMVNDSIGMLRSEKWSKDEQYRPDWHDMITTTAEVNAFRAIGKCAAPPVVKSCDSLYWVATTPPCDGCQRGKPDEHAAPCGKPDGLVVVEPLGLLGKFKLERWGDLTAAAIDAYKAGQPKAFHEAVKIADATRRETTA